MLIHKHIWRELEKTNKEINNGNGIYSCRKCKKIKGFKTPPKNVVSCSIWCPCCGRDMWDGNSKYKRMDNGISRYTCERCGTISYMRFDIAPIGIGCDEYGSPL